MSMSELAMEIETLYFENGVDINTIAVQVNWPVEKVRFYVSKLEKEILAAGNVDTLPTEEELDEMARYYGEE